MSATVQQLVSALVDRIYPIGSIVCFSKDVDQNTSIGGGWTQIKECFLLASGSKELGSKGGSETHTMSVSEMPAHTHTRGTMQITGGGVQAFIWAKNSTTKYASPSGAFSLGIAGNEEYTSPTGWAANVEARRPIDLNFTGSNGWTGATSSTGGGSAFSILPPYRAVNVWERVS